MVSVIVRVCSVVLRRTVVGVDWRFDNLSGSHHQSDDDGFRSGCRDVSQHQQQSFSGLHCKPGRSLKPQHWLAWIQTLHCYINLLIPTSGTGTSRCHVTSLLSHCLTFNQKSTAWDPVHTYAFWFWKRNFFSFSRKIASTRSIFESFLPVHTNALYHFKNAKKPVVVVDERVVITSLILKEVQAAWWCLLAFLDSQNEKVKSDKCSWKHTIRLERSPSTKDNSEACARHFGLGNTILRAIMWRPYRKFRFQASTRIRYGGVFKKNPTRFQKVASSVIVFVWTIAVPVTKKLRFNACVLVDRV